MVSLRLLHHQLSKYLCHPIIPKDAAHSKGAFPLSRYAGQKAVGAEAHINLLAEIQMRTSPQQRKMGLRSH